MRLFILLITVTLLGGCGLKGDLYLPPPKPEPGASAAPASPAADDEEKNEDPARRAP
jgi:predicted small lipoprotein YifL